MLSRIGVPVPEWKRAEGARDPNCAATMSPRGAACQFFPGSRRITPGVPENRREEHRKDCRIVPAKLDVESFDSDTRRHRKPYPVLRGGHQKRAGMFRVAAQPHKFCRTEPVMIGKRTRHDNLGPNPPQVGEKLGW